MDLVIRNFAQISEIVVPLRDLVILVGPQATGKSLVLQMLKLITDRHRIVRSLRDHGFTWSDPSQFAARYFGGGFEKSWNENTEVYFGKRPFNLVDASTARARKGEDSTFYVPAHRTLAIAEGWPRSFLAYQGDPPFVARRFSEQLLTSLQQGLGKGENVFPHDRRLKSAFRELIDDAVFHGGKLRLVVREGGRREFVLDYDDGQTRLPFMAWTAGQREFAPLLLGLYHLLPPGALPKRKDIEWAIIEEPELGLHPRAVVAVMAVVLDLLARGYKVALSTHSPTVLDVLWGMSRLKGTKGAASNLCGILGLQESKDVLKSVTAALKATYSVVHLQHDAGRVTSRDISGLDPGADDPREWGWGGLTGFSARVADFVSKAQRVGKP